MVQSDSRVCECWESIYLESCGILGMTARICASVLFARWLGYPAECAVHYPASARSADASHALASSERSQLVARRTLEARSGCQWLGELLLLCASCAQLFAPPPPPPTTTTSTETLSLAPIRSPRMNPFAVGPRINIRTEGEALARCHWQAPLCVSVSLLFALALPLPHVHGFRTLANKRRQFCALLDLLHHWPSLQCDAQDCPRIITSFAGPSYVFIPFFVGHSKHPSMVLTHTNKQMYYFRTMLKWS